MIKKEEIENFKEGGKILTDILEAVKDKIKPGVSTLSLDQLAHRLCLKYQAKPSFLNYRPYSQGGGFPKSICISINEEVVHGIPGARILKEGDIVSLDFGVYYKGLHTDKALTIGVGKILPESQKLINATYKALMFSIEKAKEGNKIGDISSVIEQTAIEADVFPVKDLAGHGIGRNLHEWPDIPNIGQKGQGPLIKQDIALAIETMFVLGSSKLKVQKDDWTIITQDHSLSAHFEETVLVTDNGPEIITQI